MNLLLQAFSAISEHVARWWSLNYPSPPSIYTPRVAARTRELFLTDLHINGCKRWRINRTQSPRLITCYYEPIRLAVRATNNPLHVQWAADLYRGKQVIHFNQTQMNTLFPKTRFNHGISRNNRF